MRKILGFLISAGVILGGCQGFGLEMRPSRPAVVDLTATAAPRKPGTSPTPTTLATYAIKIDTHNLTIWLPPQLDPGSLSHGAIILKKQMEGFETANPGVKVQSRIKALNGPGGLLQSLIAASSAAPGALPAIAVLNRQDLEEAVLKGIVQPIYGAGGGLKDADWYDYARQLASVQEKTYGLPFGGESLLIVYRPSKVGAIPNTWEGINNRGMAVIFPAADPQSLLTLALYQSMDGPMLDAQGRQILAIEALRSVLKLYADGVQQNVFPYWLSTIQNDNQAWQAFLDQKAHIIITTNYRYLNNQQTDTAVAMLPGMKSSPLSLANGWILAVTDSHPERREMSLRLSEHLVNGDFLASWTEASGYLPPRPSSLTGWSDKALKAQFNQLALASRPVPANDVSSTVGPILQEAAMSIIKRQSDPVRAAMVAVERLSVPKTR